MNVSRTGKLLRGTTSRSESLAKLCFIICCQNSLGGCPQTLPAHSPSTTHLQHLAFCLSEECSPEKVSKPWLPQGGIWIIQCVLLMLGCLIANNVKPYLEASSCVNSWVKSQEHQQACGLHIWGSGRSHSSWLSGFTFSSKMALAKQAQFFPKSSGELDMTLVGVKGEAAWWLANRLPWNQSYVTLAGS